MDLKDFQREWKDPQSNLQRLLAPLQAGNIDVSHICLIHLVGWFLTDEVLSNSRGKPRESDGVTKLHSWCMHWKTTQAQSSMASPQVFIGYWKTNGTFLSPRNKHIFVRQVAALGGGQGGGIVTAAKECDTTVSAVPVSLPRSRFWQKDCGDTLKWSQKPWEAWGIPENGQPMPGNEYEQTIFETISQEQFAICAYSLNSFHSSNNRGQYYNFCCDTT